MQLSKLFKSVCFLVLASLFIVSCSDDDSTIIEEKVEPTIESGIEIMINNRSITTDAYAWYCDANGKEGLSVSNNEALLDTIIDGFAFKDGDFLFILADDGTASYSVGGAFFDASVTGTSFSQVIFTPDLSITVDNNTGTMVSGSMEGTLLGLDDNFEPTIQLPISVTYNAEIVATSPICD